MPEAAFESLDAALRERLDRLPRDPGVYLLRDRSGEIIYVIAQYGGCELLLGVW